MMWKEMMELEMEDKGVKNCLCRFNFTFFLLFFWIFDINIFVNFCGFLKYILF